MTVADFTYPFSAIVGQPLMKRALILAAIHPGIGGVLVRGSKGAAKSTTVRALAAVLPEIEVFEGDAFGRAPGEAIESAPLPEGAPLVHRPVRLVNLPVGATDDRIVGSLNIEHALATGKSVFEPGLLAAAHRGILYIDEVNLLGDHLVDLLLDAAAMGVNHVEREGVAFRHPARFVLIGTMNPEEGDLRPQLLDRFGLAVDIEPLDDTARRVEVVRRRLAFELNPASYSARWADAEAEQRKRIEAARVLLPLVVVPDEVLEAICDRCVAEGVDGMRADLTIHKAASALAAFEGRTTVTGADVDAVAEFALAHRRTVPPRNPPAGPSDTSTNSKQTKSETTSDERSGEASQTRPRPSHAGVRDEAQGDGTTAQHLGDDDRIAANDDAETPSTIEADEPRTALRWIPRQKNRTQTLGTRPARGRHVVGDRARGQQTVGGAVVGAQPPNSGSINDLALAATLRAAVPRQSVRRREIGHSVIIEREDLRIKRRTRPRRHLVVFVVDASRSMGARRRIAEAKAAVLSLLVDAYQKRDLVALVTFGGEKATLALPPTRSVRVAAQGLSELPIGGTTPLADALALTRRVVASTRRRDAGLIPMIVLVSDGRGNVALSAQGDPLDDALSQADLLRTAEIATLVVDTESGPVRLRLAQRVAAALGGECKSLDALTGPALSDAVRKSLFARSA